MRRSGLAVLGILLAGALLRFLGLRWGFPSLVNADEPHFINLAVSFGSGDFNPHLFKYPTLWMYVLFAAYGAFYALWSGFGLIHGVGEFAGLFVWEPERFYLIARALAALCSCLALAVVAATDSELHAEESEAQPAIPWALGLLAFSPALVYSAHQGKSEALMFLLSALAWRQALMILKRGSALDYLGTGFFSGLALSAQYTAAPLLCLLPLAFLLRARLSVARTSWQADHLSSFDRETIIALVGLLAMGGGFLAGCPYALLDRPAFLEGLADHARYVSTMSRSLRETFWPAWSQSLRFAGPVPVAAMGLALGVLAPSKSRWRTALLLAAPFCLYAVFMSRQGVSAAQPKYFLATFPGLALLASTGYGRLERTLKRRGLVLALAVAVFFPGLLASARAVRFFLLADTRPLAASWIESNISEGTTLLLDQEFASPRLRMERAQASEMFRRLSARGARRALYYEAMIRSNPAHPGRSYRLYRLQRTAKDLDTLPRLVERSQWEGPLLDAREGIAALQRQGVRYVVLSSYGADPLRATEFSKLFEEIERLGTRVAEFAPDGRVLGGPALHIYRIPESSGVVNQGSRKRKASR